MKVEMILEWVADFDVAENGIVAIALSNSERESQKQSIEKMSEREWVGYVLLSAYLLLLDA